MPASSPTAARRQRSQAAISICIKAYCAEAAAQFGPQLSPYLDALQQRSPALNRDIGLRSLLREAGDDPTMHACQDAFFDRVYWAPATASAKALGIATALGGATIYDRTVHGSWRMIRDMTTAQHGTAAALGEKAWIAAYIATRRNWLATNANALLQKTVYRMDALQKLLDAGAWELPLPLSVRGVLISQDLLLGGVPVRASAQIVEERTLRLRSPFMQGDDVKQLQVALRDCRFRRRRRRHPWSQRRLAPYDSRLLRPRLMPAAALLAIRLLSRGGAPR